MKKILIVFSFITMFLLGACDTPTNGVQYLETSELDQYLNGDYQLVDVRTPTEYNEDHIEEFEINIDYYEFQNNLSMLDVLDKEQPTILICRSGNRSASAAKMMLDYGFLEVYSVNGGVSLYK